MRGAILLVLLGLAFAAGAGAWWVAHRQGPARELVLEGNVDLRQVELAFQNNERIAAVLVQEGDRVDRGQLLARLDVGRLDPQVARVEADVMAQRQIFERLKAGSRPEEIAQARANVESTKADATNARRQHDRLKDLSRGAVSLQDLENAKAALDVADARLVVNEKALDLALLGPRKEEVAEAEARLHSDEAQLALFRQYLVDARLVSPCNAVVRSRLMEPGELASPQRPVLSLAETDPKWVRAYASETELGHVRPGRVAAVTVDSFPERTFEGWVGFVSPVAEFTPKAVQTVELRTSLVYEVRVFVTDPGDDLRLGMPATVRFALGTEGSARVTSQVATGRSR
jgi:HlyD family secretion protein